MFGAWIGRDLPCKSYRHTCDGREIFAVNHQKYTKMVNFGDMTCRAAITHGAALTDASVTKLWEACEVRVALGKYQLKDFTGQNPTVNGLTYPPAMSKMARLTGLKRRRAEFDEEIGHLEAQLTPAAKRLQGFVAGKVARDRSRQATRAIDIQEQIAKIDETREKMMKELEDSKAALMAQLGEIGGGQPPRYEEGKKGKSDLKYWKRKYWGERRATMKSQVDTYIEKNGGMTASAGYELEKSVVGNMTHTSTPSGLWGGSASGTNPRKKAMLEWGYKWVMVPGDAEGNVGGAAKWWAK